MILEGLKGYRGYPGGFKAYRKRYPTVELSWWHRVPDWATLSRLRRLAPRGFRFSVYGHKHFAFRPTGEERRTLRRFFRRFKALGEKRGAVRIPLPELGPEDLEAWLGLLEEVLEELGGRAGFAIAFEAPPALKAPLRERGYALVNEAGGPFFYLVDPEGVPAQGEGFVYRAPFPSLAPGSKLIPEVDPD